MARAHEALHTIFELLAMKERSLTPQDEILGSRHHTELQTTYSKPSFVASAAKEEVRA